MKLRKITFIKVATSTSVQTGNINKKEAPYFIFANASNPQVSWVYSTKLL